MKYLGSYDTLTAYKEDTSIEAPNVSLVEGKCIYKPIVKTNFGDVALYNSKTAAFEFCSVTAYTKSLSHLPHLTPIGVVAVPAMYSPDNTTRVMSLKNMSCYTPESGSVADLNTSNGSSDYDEDINMKWGATGAITGITYTPNINCVNPLTGETLTVSPASTWARIPSDPQWSSTGYLDPNSGYRYYYGASSGDNAYSTTGDSHLRFGPYPILKNGSKNPQYYAEGMCTNDFDGRGHTTAILNSTNVNWQNTSSIDGMGTGTGNYPPVFCCSRYSTTGTSSGDWYLPAQGELAFLIAKYGAINGTLKTLAQFDSTLAAHFGERNSATYGDWLWSSSLFDSSYARDVDLSGGHVYYTTRSHVGTYNRVRAFLAL